MEMKEILEKNGFVQEFRHPDHPDIRAKINQFGSIELWYSQGDGHHGVMITSERTAINFAEIFDGFLAKIEELKINLDVC